MRRQRRSIWIALASAAAIVTSASVAAQNLKACPASASPSTCLAETAVRGLQQCQFITGLQLKLFRLDGTKPDYACEAKVSQIVAPLYSQALKAPKANANGIKDFYAAWRSALGGTQFELGETERAYQARQIAAARAIDAQSERLKLD